MSGIRIICPGEAAREDERRRVLAQLAKFREVTPLIGNDYPVDYVAWTSVLSVLGKSVLNDQDPIAEAVTAERERIIAVLADLDDCLDACDQDCEAGPLHCLWLHQPRHKPGWHDQGHCPHREFTRHPVTGDST